MLFLHFFLFQRSNLVAQVPSLTSSPSKTSHIERKWLEAVAAGVEAAQGVARGAATGTMVSQSHPD